MYFSKFNLETGLKPVFFSQIFAWGTIFVTNESLIEQKRKKSLSGSPKRKEMCSYLFKEEGFS